MIEKFILLKLLFGGLMFLSTVGFAQKEPVQKKMEYSKRSAQSNVMDELDQAERLSIKNPTEALDVVQRALTRSLEEKNKTHESYCYLLIADINRNIEEWQLAVNNYKKAELILSQTEPDGSGYKRSIKGQGQSYLKLQEYDKAIAYFEKALKLNLTSQEHNEVQINLSEAHSRLGQNEKALDILQSGSRPSSVYDNVKVQNQKGKIYNRMNDVEKAQKVYYENIETSSGADQSEKIKPEVESLGELKEGISEILQEQNRFDEEILLRNQSIEYNLENKNLKAVPNDKVFLSKALVAKGETEAAIRELKEAVLIADTTNNPREKAVALASLAQLYESNGSTNNALHTYQRYIQAVNQVEKLYNQKIEERTEILKKQNEIEELAKFVLVEQQEATLSRETVFRQRLIIYGLLLILSIIAITSYFIYKSAKESKIANQLLALKSLRSQMNPHFIFNALNSVNHFVSQHDERTANRFLTEFSRLMRLVLENSQEDFIPLFKEEEIISLYLKLEQYRFRDKFDYHIMIDDDLNREAIYLPPMLVQPYIENAVWHGLRYKEEKGQLDLVIKKDNEHLTISISDNGIGRDQSAKLKTTNQQKHNSSGLKNIRERLAIINKVYKTSFTVAIENLDPTTATGTKVIITAPLNYRHESHHS